MPSSRRTPEKDSPRYRANVGITYFSPAIMKRIYEGEKIPLDKRGPSKRVEAGELIPAEALATIEPSLSWLIGQNLVEEVKDHD